MGSDITLEFDQDLLDPYDRQLAGVFADGTLINAEIARAGLGVPVYFAPNDRFLDEVQSAHAEARSTGVGLYDPTAGCTIPAQVSALEKAAQQLSESAPAEGASSTTIELPAGPRAPHG